MRKLVVILAVVFLLSFAHDILAQGTGFVPPAGEKDPNTALVLSALVPGVGQYYNEQVYYKGIAFGLAEALGWVIIGATDDDWFGVTIICANHIASAVDAYVQAGKVNQGVSLNITPEGPVLAYSHSF